MAALVCLLPPPVPRVEAAAPAGMKERLRRLVRLPRVSFGVGVEFRTFRGFTLLTDPAAVRREIGELQKAMQGNSSDAARYDRIAALEGDFLDEPAKAAAAGSKAVELYRQEGVDQSNDARLLAGYGTALARAGEFEAAERILRRAVMVDTREWRAHAALGSFLARSAFHEAMPAGSANDPTATTRFLSGDPAAAPKAEQVEKSRRLIAEGMERLDAAVRQAPDEGEVYATRATVVCTRDWLEALFRSASNDEGDRLALMRAPFSTNVLVDLRAAARLQPKDYRAWGTLVLFEVCSAALEHGAAMDQVFGGGGWNSLPDAVRRGIREGVQRLEAIAQEGEPRAAAGALEVLGVLQTFIMGNEREGETNLRRAVRLDPARNNGWEFLIMYLARSEKSHELLEVCQERLRQQDTARNRLLVAKSYERLNQLDRVREECEVLQRRYPDDFNANLALAAALLKGPTDDLLIARSVQLLSKAESLAAKSPSREQVANLLFLRGLFLGLVDQVEGARANLKKLLEIDSDQEDAKEALEILEQAA